MFSCCLGNGRFGVSTFYATTNTALTAPATFIDELHGSETNNGGDANGNSASASSSNVISPIYHGVQPSVRVLGNFQRLLTLSHRNIARYIDAMVGRHEQVVFVQEFYENTLKDAIKQELYKENMQACLRIGCQLEMALAYLHSEGLIVGNIAPANVMLCSAGTWPPHVKLYNYGLFWTSENGTLVDFPLISPSYLAPEIIMSARLLAGNVPSTPTSTASTTDNIEYSELNFIHHLRQSSLRLSVFSDVWMLGVVLAELFTATELSSTASNLHQLMDNLVNVALRTSGETASACDMIFRILKFKILPEDTETYKEDCVVFEKLIRGCLEALPSSRILPSTALTSLFSTDLLAECTKPQNASMLFCDNLNPFAPRRPNSLLRNGGSVAASSGNNGGGNDLREEEMFEGIPDSASVTDHLRQTRPMEEVYYLLSLVSPDPRVLVKRTTMQVRSLPPISKLAPIFLSKADRAFGAAADRGTLYGRAVVEIPLEPLMTRLDNLHVEDLYCLLETYPELDEYEQQLSRRRQAFFDEIQKQPLIIRERDPEYQLHRCVLFHRLLEGYPFTRAKLLAAARIDIVPLYRGLVWCCLLNVPSDAQEHYANMDTETLHPSHRQIDVDIPRCHQYDDLLASHVGRIKLKRVLTAWLRKNPNNVYWQGLDSLLAPFLRLNFTNEGLALACFQRFIEKYLNNFFTRDNSDVVREYLCVFSHLIAFHDAELSAHLLKIGFVPDLYAISWFLTAFAHVFPLTKLYHLYDTLLQYDNSFLICIGLAVLEQMRPKLISYEFNDCILLSSDMSDFDVARLVADAVMYYNSTPPSLLRHPLSEPAVGATETTSSSLSSSSTNVGGGRISAGGAAAGDLILQAGSRRSAAAVAAALTSAANSAANAEPIVLTDPCGRISVDDLQSLWNAGNTAAAEKLVVVIDVRSPEEFSRGCFPGSINVPASTLSDSSTASLDPQLQRFVFDTNENGNHHQQQQQDPTGGAGAGARQSISTTFVVVCGKNGFAMAAECARRLAVDYVLSRVCILSGGTDALGRAAMLVIP